MSSPFLLAGIKRDERNNVKVDYFFGLALISMIGLLFLVSGDDLLLQQLSVYL
jgi:hypothetical protein